MLERPWPEDLPITCPNCGKAFRSGVNLVVGPGKGARRLRGFAYAMAVPWAIITVAAYAVAGMPNFGRSGGYAIVGMIIMPPAMIAITSIFFPLSRRVACICGWREEFAIHPRQAGVLTVPDAEDGSTTDRSTGEVGRSNGG